ncbi:MAG TPA: hypothetical protein VFZ04_00300, partial [Longimicrobiales bacterium]
MKHSTANIPRIVTTLAVAATLHACDGATDTTTPGEFAAQFTAASAAENQQLAQLRQLTARFQNFAAAGASGYTTPITPCWAHHAAGAMGYHYGNTALFDANANLLEPEVLMYEPQTGGHLKLVGMEYIVPLAAWQAAGHDLNDPNDVPVLLGQNFTQHSFLPIFKL